MADIEGKPKLDGRPLRPGHPWYDAEDAAELERRCQRIAKLRTNSDIDQWREGDEYLHIRVGRLYRQAGFPYMAPWVRAQKRSRATVARRMRFADSFSLADVRRFGKEMLDLGDEYVALTRKDDLDWTPASLVVLVPRAGGRLDEVAFSKADIADLENAVQHQRELQVRRRQDGVPDPDRRIYQALARGVETAAGPLARLELQPGKLDGEATTLHIAVRMPDLASLVAHLQAVLEQQRLPGR